MSIGVRGLMRAGWFMAGLSLVAGAMADAALERRTAYRDELQRLLPKSPAWEQWLQRTGELPPDFSVMPGQPSLPDPLRFANGHRVS